MLRIFAILFLFFFSIYELVFGERDYNKELEKDFEKIYKEY